MKTCIFKLILITYFKSYYNLKIFPNFQNFAFKKSNLDIYIGHMEIWTIRITPNPPQKNRIYFRL